MPHGASHLRNAEQLRKGKIVKILDSWFIDKACAPRDTSLEANNIRDGKYMSDKPSLYVVERKEVVILVVLFVLVTVLAFTMGVKYGESVGRKHGHEEAAIQKQESGAEEEKLGGTLGEGKESKTASAEAPAHEAAVKDEGHHEAAQGGEAGQEKAAEKETHAAKTEEPKAPEKQDPDVKATVSGATAAAVDANSDEYLLNALKNSQIEPPKGKAQELPSEVKSIKAGTYVIQVGSHPTRAEADDQVRALKAKKISAKVLPPVKEKNAQWHRVVISGFKNKADADREAKLLKSRNQIASYFIWRF